MVIGLIGFVTGVAIGMLATVFLQVRRTTRGRYFSI